LGRTDARHLSRPEGLQDGRGLGRELEGIAISRRNDRGAPPPLLARDGGGQKIVSLVARRLGRREPAGTNSGKTSSCSTSSSSNSRPDW
jgi:hypothetical protein